jgi:hypothetical protein
MLRTQCVRGCNDACCDCPHMTDESLPFATTMSSPEEQRMGIGGAASYMGSSAYLDDAGF